ncbi:MAG: GAF domain-containing protein [Chloroflexota bacterium]
MRAPQFVEEEEQRIARLLNFFSAYMVVFALFGGAVRLWVGDARIPFLVSGLTVLAVGLTQLLMRQGFLRQAGIFLTTAVWVSLSIALFINGGVYTPSFSLMMIVIVIASLVVDRNAAIIFAVLSTAIGFVVFLGMRDGWLVQSPIPQAATIWGVISSAGFLGTAVVLYIAVGDLESILFRLRTSNRDLIVTRNLLEASNTERSRDIALATEIGQILSQIQNLDELLSETVKLVYNHFNLYHAQIYLLDKASRVLVLRASSGITGTEILQHGHRLPLGAGSVNGTAAAQQKTIAISDIRTSKLFRANSFLPDTQSELSIPLMIGTELIGVLDLQSSQPYDPIIEKTDLFELLTSQIAVAVKNAQLFSKASASQEIWQTETKQSIYEGWREYLDAIDQREYQGYEYAEVDLNQLLHPLSLYDGDGITLPIKSSEQQIGVVQLEKAGGEAWDRHDIELIEAVSGQLVNRLENIRLLANAEKYRIKAERSSQRLVQDGWHSFIQTEPTSLGFVYHQAEVVPSFEMTTKPEAKLAVSFPVTVQGAQIGYLEAGAEALNELPSGNEDVYDLVKVIATQLGTHIENLRLTQQTEIALAESRARANDLAFVNRIVSRISASHDLESSLQFIVDELVKKLDIPQARIALLDETGSKLRVVSERHDPLRTPSALDAEIPIANSPATSIAISKRKTVVVPDPQTSILTQSVHDLMREQAIETLVIIPLAVGNRVLGTVGLDILEVGHSLSQEQIKLAETVVFQAAATLQSAQAFEQTQQALLATETLYEGSDRIVKADTIEDVLMALLQAPSLANLDRASLSFFDKALAEGERLQAFTRVVGWMRDAGSHSSDRVDTTPERFDAEDYPSMLVLSDPYTPAIVYEIETDARLDAAARERFVAGQGLHGLMNFPLTAGDLWIGMFTGLTEEPLTVSDKDLRQISALIDQAAVVLQNKRLLIQTEAALTETEEQARRLSMLNELSSLLGTANTVERAFVGVAKYSEEIFSQIRLSVALLTEDRLAFRLMSLKGEDEVVHTDITFPLAGTAVSAVIADNKLITVDDLHHSSFSEIRPLRQQGVRSVIMAPMTTPAGVLGVLTVGRPKPRAFTAADQNVVTQIASLFAATIENRRLLANARKQADRAEIVNSINQKIQGTTTMEAAVQMAIQELGQALRAKYTQIELTQPNGQGDV